MKRDCSFYSEEKPKNRRLHLSRLYCCNKENYRGILFLKVNFWLFIVTQIKQETVSQFQPFYGQFHRGK